MRLVNDLGLPKAMFDAIARDEYTKGDADFSATELVGPACISKLKRRHDDEIVVPVSRRLWMWMGTAIHAALEKGGDCDTQFVEHRFYKDIEVGGRTYKIGGKPDLYDPTTGQLYDYKLVGVYSLIYNEGPKEEYVAQMNILTNLIRANGHKVDTASICNLLRDWREGEFEREDSYPARYVQQDPELWPDAQTDAYLQDRIARHVNPQLVECTKEERWERPTTYAVMSTGRKSAHRVLDGLVEANQWLEEHRKPGMYVQHRKGLRYRCAKHCDAAEFCPFWAKARVEP